MLSITSIICSLVANTYIQYRRFWSNPEATPVSWLSLLFAMMALSSLSILSIGEEHPDRRGATREIVDLYRRSCVQCLVLSNVAKPGPNTIESLILHMEGEYVINKANPVHFYLLVGNAVRLALRMGLHRDPSKLRSNVTVFQAGKSVLLIMLSLFFILHLNFSPKKSISFTPTPNSQKPLF